MSYKYCCDDFEAATMDKTDNEAYDALIRPFNGRWYAGNESKLSPIEHCPWCGVKLRLPPDQS